MARASGPVGSLAWSYGSPMTVWAGGSASRCWTISRSSSGSPAVPNRPLILLQGARDLLDLNGLNLPPVAANYAAVWRTISNYCAKVAGNDAVLIDTTEASISLRRTVLAGNSNSLSPGHPGQTWRYPND